MMVKHKIIDRLKQFRVGDTVRVHTDTNSDEWLETLCFNTFETTTSIMNTCGKKALIRSMHINGNVDLVPVDRMEPPDDWTWMFDVFMIEKIDENR